MMVYKAFNVLNISLSSLNVIDDADAKIGFVAWEAIAVQVNETLTINLKCN
jgi:hypothetical protein